MNVIIFSFDNHTHTLTHPPCLLTKPPVRGEREIPLDEEVCGVVILYNYLTIN